MQSFNLPAEAKESIQHSSRFSVFNIFRRDYEHWKGVPRINIYLLRLLFSLMFLFLSYDSWSYILHHTGTWDGTGAAAWCMWASYSLISFIGIFRPLRMLPIVLFEIVYKIAWLVIVAYPLWMTDKLISSPVEGTTYVFLWVVFPMVAMPWRYFFRTQLLGKETA